MEYWLTETAVLASIIDNNFNEYTCSTVDRPFLACLDIASPSTLSGTINSSYSIDSENDLLQGVTQTYVNADPTSTNLFGVNRLCGGKVQGDGILDILDLSVLTWIIFRVSPYQYVTANTHTVNAETDVEDRCYDNITRNEYLDEYDMSDPCSIPTNLPVARRLSENDGDLNVKMHLHQVREDGSWFHIRLEDTLIAVELLLEGIDSRYEINLNNLRAPFHGSRVETHIPFDKDRIEVRYARHMEYIDEEAEASSDCAVIQGLVASGALYRSTMGVGQIPTVQEGVEGYFCARLTCSFTFPTCTTVQ